MITSGFSSVRLSNGYKTTSMPFTQDLTTTSSNHLQTQLSTAGFDVTSAYSPQHCLSNKLQTSPHYSNQHEIYAYNKNISSPSSKIDPTCKFQNNGVVSSEPGVTELEPFSTRDTLQNENLAPKLGIPATSQYITPARTQLMQGALTTHV